MSINDRACASIELSDREKKLILDAFPNGMVAFDLETTGLSPVLDKIIEIAAIKIDKKGNTSFFHQMINPLITIPEHTIQYHQITNDMVQDAQTLKNPLRDFIKFYDDLPLVAHNAQFDAGYVVRGHHEYNFDFSLSDIYDSCKFARLLFRKASKDHKPENFKLSSLADYYGIEFTHHIAMDDAVVSLKVFANCLDKLVLDNRLNELRDLSFLFKLNSFKKPADYILPNKLSLLKDCVPTRTSVAIEYKGGNIEGPRNITPIALLPMPQGLVLYAECLHDNMNKNFLVRKIKSVKSI